MSVVTPFILEADTGVCILVCRGNPNTLGIVAAKGSIALDATNAKLYMSNDSDTSDWTEKT